MSSGNNGKVLRSNVPWCPTLVLLSKTCFLLSLPGSYGSYVNIGNSCELKLRLKKTFVSCVSFRKFRNVQTRSDILKFLLFLTNVDCWNCLAMVNVIISLFPLFVFLKQEIAQIRLRHFATQISITLTSITP